EEGNLDVLRDAMVAEEPALALDAIEGRIPFDCLVHVGGGAHDERVELPPDVAFPAQHGRDIGLHGGIAVALGDLTVAAGDEDWLTRLGPLRSDPIGGLLCDVRRLSRRLVSHRVYSRAEQVTASPNSGLAMLPSSFPQCPSR